MASDPDDTARALNQDLGPLRRAVSRATRSAAGLPELPDNQVEVLRALVATPGVGTSELAARLQLARPTVSNLLQAMRRAGLVELTRPRDDGRLVEVVATDVADDLLERFDQAANAVLAEALRQLSAKDLAKLQSALPALGRLNELLRTS